MASAGIDDDTFNAAEPPPLNAQDIQFREDACGTADLGCIKVRKFRRGGRLSIVSHCGTPPLGDAIALPAGRKKPETWLKYQGAGVLAIRSSSAGRRVMLLNDS
jgi:hypothetical protein